MKFIFILIAFALGGCSGSEGDHQDATHTSKDKNTPGAESVNIQTVKPAFTSLEANVSEHITKIFSQYFIVKTALVNSSPIDAKNAASSLGEMTRNFDKSLLTPEQLQAYNKEISGIKTSANSIASTDDLNKQREYFAALSIHAYGLAKSFGAGKVIYHDHCPMAFNKKGAMWLSEIKPIQNPYYGEKMMKCGSVEEVIE